MASPAQSGVARDALERLERALDRLFGAAGNPLRHLGALVYAAFWLIALSGLYLYVFFDTSVGGAWSSVSALQGGLVGSVLRGVHRYASDAFMLLCLLHLAREWILGRYRGVRWFTWVSGVPLVWLTWLAGVVGFWLVWDELGAFSAGATLEWLDALAVFSEPLPRNVLLDGRVDDRLFSLFVFTHIGLSLFLLLGMWLHTQRLTRPDNLPVPALMAGVTVTLVLLALLLPVSVGPAADLRQVPLALEFDWFFLAPHALQYLSTPVTLWVALLLGTGMLCLLPWWRRRQAPAAARVDPAHCNGCGRCFVDCPYAAVTMLPSPGHKGLGQLAVVNADLCAGCGICAGACPSSTPFRSGTDLVSGIDMPQRTVGELRQTLRHGLASLDASVPRILVIGCDQGADIRSLPGDAVVGMSLLCAGQLPPAFVEYALREGAAGVVVVACPEGGCEFRLGERWTAQRLTGQRDPYLRAGVDGRRWMLIHAGRTELERVVQAARALRAHLRTDAVHG